MGEARIRLLCVDDHTLVRQGLSLLIAQEQDMEVVASAATGHEALKQYRLHRPDVTLMDLQLPGGMSGFEVIRCIRDEDDKARIVVLTVYHGDEDIARALEAGAAAYLLKDTLADDLIRVIREVYVGGRSLSLSPHVAAQLARHMGQRPVTPRELQVIELLARGLRNKEIAATLGITEDTAHVHVRSIFSKLGVHDRTAALAEALRRGLIHME
jgi:DNA-binding NarL/FixJ family response regulator